ncbi:hypothetical protein KDL29_15155 [bacterium]|nr:hypothetical protein [bacterium]
MRITIGQFIGLLLIAAAIYYFVSPWWGNQDRDSWINRWNNSIIDDGRDDGSASLTNKKDESEPYDPSGWN